MLDVDAHLSELAKDTRPFNSTQLSPEEDDLLFHNPALRYQDQVHPTTGMPYTNAQAAQQMVQDMGAQGYVSYVEDYVRRADRRNDGDAALNPPLPVAPPPGPPPSPVPAEPMPPPEALQGGM